MRSLSRLGRHLLTILLALPLAAEASGLRLTPLRLDVSARAPTTQIQLTNLERTPVAVQIKAFRWTQVDGKDVYEPTQDIFFAPPIVTVPAQGSTTVRFRLRAKAPAQMEAAYRVYFQEIPSAESEAVAGMNFRIRFGVPLFVAAAKPAPAALAVDAARTNDGLALTLANKGKAHVKIEGVELYPGTVDRKAPGAPLASATHSAAGTNYLLPATTHGWQMPMPAQAQSGPLALLVRTNDFSGRASPGMTDRGWVWLQVPP